MNPIAHTPDAVRRHSHRSQSAMIRIGFVLGFAAISSLWEVWISPAVAKTLVAATRNAVVEKGE